MDIMNNMTVSTSKLTFSLIAITALLVSGSAFLDQDAFAAITFTAISNSTTQTEIIFSKTVNGTLNNENWYVDGAVITAISNGTEASALTKAEYGAGTEGIINSTTRIVLTHAAISDQTADVRYIISGQYTGAAGVQADIAAAVHGDIGRGGNLGGGNAASAAPAVYENIANNTSVTSIDGQPPTITSAVTLGPKTIEITFNEPVGNQNVTADSFTLTGTDAVITSITRDHNGTETMLLGVQNAIDWRDTFTLGFAASSQAQFLTDATNSPFHGDSATYTTTDFAITMLGSGHQYVHKLGALVTANDGKNAVGNQLQNFTGLAIDSRNIYSVSNDSCFDCSAPTITNVMISTPASNPMDLSFDDPVHVTAEVGDTITISVTYDDNKGAASIPFAGIYTNFVDSPEISNLYYKNNFDGLLQMSTSYYEWNVRGDDIAYDNDGALTWDVATSEVVADTQRSTLTYTLTINDDFESSQVWIDVSDANGNYLKTSLPITIEVAGDPSLTFASNGNQKVTSFFNENILFAIVSQWAASSDNTANTSELSSVLGIENDALPEWTTSLATWAADDKIDIADMVIAVEYVINQ